MGICVLLVDDNSSCAHAARVLLERQGACVVGVACNSAEAVELASELCPDVVLIDLMLGDESGFDLAELLSRDRSDDAPILILISAHSLTDVAELVATSSAAGFLPKSELSVEAIGRIIGGGSLAVKDR